MYWGGGRWFLWKSTFFKIPPIKSHNYFSTPRPPLESKEKNLPPLSSWLPRIYSNQHYILYLCDPACGLVPRIAFQLVIWQEHSVWYDRNISICFVVTFHKSHYFVIVFILILIIIIIMLLMLMMMMMMRIMIMTMRMMMMMMMMMSWTQTMVVMVMMMKIKILVLSQSSVLCLDTFLKVLKQN